jgi:hypothetical protein
LRVSAMAGVVTGKIEPWWPNIEISMVILGCQENGPRGIFRIKGASCRIGIAVQGIERS